ncbi:MAG TPA: alpha/beta hydrolase, partial [Cytophagaceae bacterium]|nr:alpha/beta hydrolase [Cytophagaceae bacterium]
MRFLVLLSILFLQAMSLFGKDCRIYKDIHYAGKSEKPADDPKQTLDVYVPQDKIKTKEVVVFIHGGSWNSGRKDTYRFLGRGFASKGIITVIINYRLTPEVNYLPMAMDCALAVKWVYEHITEYDGDPNKIMVAGHSAGGHLAALISNDPYFWASLKMKNPIKGCVLIDAFGLNMYTYFPTSHYKDDFSFKKTFSSNP